MSRPVGSKNKPKISGTNGMLVVKNKKMAKALANHPRCAPETDRLEELLTWGPKIEAFCEKKGFPPSELIEKFEGLEKRITLVVEQKQEVVDAYAAHLEESQNKPNTAPETEKQHRAPQRTSEVIQRLRNDQSGEEESEKEGMPEGLTPIQQAVWRNNQKMKEKTPPKTEFGVTKKDKK